MAAKRDIFLKHFGAHIREIRTKKQITQFDLASIIGKDRQSIQRVEGGNVNPTIYYLNEISEGLEVPLSEIVSFQIPEKTKKRKQ